MSERNSRLQNYVTVWTQKSLKYRRRKIKEAAEVVSDD